MLKFFLNTDFSFDLPASALVTDTKVLTKRASARDLLKFERTPGQTDLHVIALGAYEGTGYNRNGDAFLESDCRKNHCFFKQAGRAVHRHHKNRSDDPKYGTIKASAYNEPMRRIELIVGLDNDKCADILAEQEREGQTNWSMASKQAFDSCSWCGHRARNDKERCEHIPAKLGELREDGEVCGMINPDPRWFEISYVRRPADRIGMSLKLASDQRVRPMTTQDYLQLYPGFVPPPDDPPLVSAWAYEKRDLATKLAALEKRVEAVADGSDRSSGLQLFILRRARGGRPSRMSDPDMDELRKGSPGSVFRGLADRSIIFSPGDFLRYLLGDRVTPGLQDGLQSALPGVFCRMLDQGCDREVNDESFEPAGLSTCPLAGLLDRLMPEHSLAAGPASRRAIRITLTIAPADDPPTLRKAASVIAPADDLLARTYATYKLAALRYIQGRGALSLDTLVDTLLQQR